MHQEASCFCEAKVSPVALSAIPVTVNWLSDKRYICVRINYQAGSFSRQSKSRYDRRLSLEKPEVYSSTTQNLYTRDCDVGEMYSRAVLIDINGLDMLCYMSQTMKKFAKLADFI